MAKTLALGTVLKQGVTVVGKLTSIGPPAPEKSEIPSTTFESTVEETLAGLINTGEMALSGLFDYTDAGQTILRADANDPAATDKAWTIEFTRQAMKFTFSGWVKSYRPNADAPNGPYTFSASVRVTTAVTASAL